MLNNYVPCSPPYSVSFAEFNGVNVFFIEVEKTSHFYWKPKSHYKYLEKYYSNNSKKLQDDAKVLVDEFGTVKIRIRGA